MNILGALLFALAISTQQDNAAPLVHIAFVVPAGLDRQTLTQNGLAALTAQSVLRTPVDGVPLEDASPPKAARYTFPSIQPTCGLRSRLFQTTRPPCSILFAGPSLLRRSM